MTRAAHVLHVARRASLVGVADYYGAMSLPVWAGGWFLRMVTQVIFFALIGRLLDSTATVHYLVIGNAVMLAALGSLIATQSSAWERYAGTLPLLVASPTSAVTVFASRSLVVVADGMAISLGAFVVVAPLFGVDMVWSRVPALPLLVLAVGLSVYALGTFLGGIAARAPSTRNVVANVAQGTIMAVCGVNVPVSFYPEPVEWLANVLPLTHGLQAVRELLAGEPLLELLPNVGLELGVGVGWLLLALLSFDRLAEGGRKDGSIEFGA
jgi:ABC-2 type transport system permease protein